MHHYFGINHIYHTIISYRWMYTKSHQETAFHAILYLETSCYYCRCKTVICLYTQFLYIKDLSEGKFKEDQNHLQPQINTSKTILTFYYTYIHQENGVSFQNRWNHNTNQAFNIPQSIESGCLSKREMHVIQVYGSSVSEMYSAVLHRSIHNRRMFRLFSSPWYTRLFVGLDGR